MDKSFEVPKLAFASSTKSRELDDLSHTAFFAPAPINVTSSANVATPEVAAIVTPVPTLNSPPVTAIPLLAVITPIESTLVTSS